MNRRAASRYAEALLGAAQGGRAVEQVRHDLDALVQLVNETPLLRGLIERPDLEADQKFEALRAALGDQFSALTMSLLRVLLEHGRGPDLEAVRDSYHDLADEAEGIVRADARSVVSLTPEQRRRLIAALEKLTERKIVLTERIDPAVLAGVTVQVDDQLIDGSAAGRFARLREELLGTRA